MVDKLASSKRLAKNSFLLYIRMIIVMIINLYVVRVVLKSLGVEDFGIYDVVSGIVTLLISLSNVFSTATQRFYSSYIGEDKVKNLTSIFSASINIYLILSIIAVLLGETIGLWFINTKLVIPYDRIVAANWIYQFSIFSLILTFLQIPYLAAMIANENLGVFALISTSESILKLVTVLLIFNINGDGLVIYGLTLFLISIIVFFFYVIIGHMKYEECRYHRKVEKNLLKEMISFSGWSLFGSVAGVSINQVITILINIFFGPSVNAARAISIQFSLALTSLTSSFLLAVRPQMIKSYAEGSFLYLNKLFNLSNKLIYFSLLIVCLPLIFEMNIILFFWLNYVDPQTALFSKLILVYALIMSLNNPISIIIQATGHVKEYHIAVEAITLLCAPVTFFLFKLGYPAYSTYAVMIIATILAHGVRLILLEKFYPAFNFSHYIKSFLLPATLITGISAFLIFLFSNIDINPLLRLLLEFVISILTITILLYFLGLSKAEKLEMKNIFNYLKTKIAV